MVGFLNNYFELLQFIEIIYMANKYNQYIICLSFIPFVRLFMRNIQTAVISTHIENSTHVYMNLFTRNSPYCHLLKYLLKPETPCTYTHTHTHKRFVLGIRFSLKMSYANLNMHNNIQKGKVHPRTSHEGPEGE